MTARTHDMFAFGFLLTATVLYPPTSITTPTLVTALVGNVVGALIPDMDQASNRLWDLLPAGNFLGKIGRHLFLGHRTISHSILGGYLLYLFLNFTLPKVFNPDFINTQVLLASVMIGFVSHLFADSLTKEGVPLFFPFSIKVGIPPIKLLRITTGHFLENWVVFPSITMYCLYVVYANQEVFLALLHSVRAP